MISLSELLQSMMQRAGIGTLTLSKLTGIPRSSIENWREGTAQRPKHWRPLLQIARVLMLDATEVETLLTAAGYPALATLGRDLCVDDPDWPYLQPWLSVPTARAVPPLTSAYHQLRAPIGDFVGRENEIAQVRAALLNAASGGVAAITGVQGMGGIGKTELAYQAAYELRETFPDAQIVLNLNGTSPMPLSPAQALQAVIRAFTPEVELPDDAAILEAHYRSVLHNQRVLILADDARDATQVRALLPPPGCGLLLTSRQRFTLPGMTTLHLEPLLDTEAVALVHTICPRLDQTAAVTLAQVCAYLPLALRVSAAMLQTTPALPIDTYLKRLADARQRLLHLRHPDDPQLDVEASLASSYQQLDEGSQHMFRQLGVFGADFTAELAGRVVQPADGQEVDTTLYHLLRRNLILYYPQQDRWRLHDLVRDLVWQLLEERGETRATMRRYTEAMVSQAQLLQARYQTGGDQALVALAAFDTERLHIEAAWVWGLTQVGTPEGDQFLLDIGLATLLLGELRWDTKRERLPRLQAALSAAERLDQPHAQGRLLLHLGRATFDLGSVRESTAIWERALALFHTLEDAAYIGRTLGNLATAYVHLGETQLALPMYSQALEIFYEMDDQRGQAQVLGNLGGLYAEIDTPLARSYLEQALACTRTIGDRRFEGMILHALGDVTRPVRTPEEALTACTEALKIARELGDRAHEGTLLISVGCAYTALGADTDAQATFAQALTILQDCGNHWGEAECRWHYGLLLLVRQRDQEQALPMLRASVAYLEAIGHAQTATYTALLDQLEDGEVIPPVLPLRWAATQNRLAA